MANTNLSEAKNAKNDEFYTQYADIQKEVNAYIEYNPDVFRGKTILLGSIIKVGVPPQIGEENKKRTSISEKNLI